MSLSLAAMVLLSALLHPLWNALIKRDPRPEGAFIGLVTLLLVFSGGHALIAGYDLLAIRRIWPLVLMSWGGQMLYGNALIHTLRHGELSAYYPIVRSSPLFVVAAGVLFLGEDYSWPLLAGIALVLSGAFAIQYRPGVRLLDDPRTLGIAVVALCGTGIYSIVDALAMRQVEPPVMFFWVEVLSLPSYILIFRYGIGRKPEWAALFSWAGKPLRFIGIGLICYVSYILILLAYGQGADVAAVTSVRQASIPISVLLGGLWLKEKSMARRLGASLVLSAGIVVIVLAG